MNTSFKISNHYHQHVLIGKGSFGEVYRSRDRVTAQVVAIKVIYLGNSNDSSHSQQLSEELEIMNKIRGSKYMTQLYDYHIVNNQLNLVMEYCAGRTCEELARYFGGLDEWQIRLVSRDIVLGLIELHQMDITHRDIKGANLLLTMEGRVKLADFGTSCSGRARMHEMVGTPYWMPPEICNRGKVVITHSHPERETYAHHQQKTNGDKPKYDNKIDIWCLGITTLELTHSCAEPPLSLHTPFNAMSAIPLLPPPRLVDRSDREAYSQEFHNFVTACLQFDPKDRTTAAELGQTPFLRPVLNTGSNLEQYVAAMVNNTTPPPPPPTMIPQPPPTKALARMIYSIKRRISGKERRWSQSGGNKDNLNHDIPQQRNSQQRISRASESSSQVPSYLSLDSSVFLSPSIESIRRKVPPNDNTVSYHPPRPLIYQDNDQSCGHQDQREGYSRESLLFEPMPSSGGTSSGGPSSLTRPLLTRPYLSELSSVHPIRLYREDYDDRPESDKKGHNPRNHWENFDAKILRDTFGSYNQGTDHQHADLGNSDRFPPLDGYHRSPSLSFAKGKKKYSGLDDDDNNEWW